MLNLRNLKKLSLITIILLAGFISSCSTRKNTFTSRAYHNLTAHYNVFFNGNESYKKGIKRMTQQHKDDYTLLLPVFIYPGTEAANGVTSDMDRTIKKASKTIALHSITAKPNYKKGIMTERQKAFYNKKEYNKWIDDAYLLMAKAYLVKGELNYVNNILRQIIKEYPKENTYIEAQLLLARKLILENEFTESLEILESVSKQKKLSRKHKHLLNAIFAEYYMNKEMSEKAVEKLETAILFAPDKPSKLRYTFICGQLYQQSGKYRKAAEMYNRVIKMNPPYEMTFNARINMANVYEAGKGNANEIRKRLLKLLSDEKNTEYRDQIYYAIGNLYLAENEKEKAIENYKLSVYTSISNPRQKARSYLTLADLYYKDRVYLISQAYYDSALTIIDEKYPDYKLIENRARGLTLLAKSLQTIAFEDSVQFVAKMSENERNIFIDKIIASVKEKEAEEARRQQELLMEQQNNLMAYNEMQWRSSNSSSVTGAQGWYFYNLSTRSSGEAEFKLKWGNRKLEDNWRRSNKAILSAEGEEIETDTDSQSDGDEKNKARKNLNNKTREYYLIDLPLTDSAMHASHERILSNLFISASIYKNDLQEYSLAANQYQEIIRRYPNQLEAAEAYFQLYMLYRQQNNISRAEEYKSKLITQFPNTTFAKLLANPNFINELQDKERKVNNLYEQAFIHFNQGNFEQSLQLSQQGLIQYPSHPLNIKFTLLHALSKGKIWGNDTLRVNLINIIKLYSKTEEANMAKSLLSTLDAIQPESKLSADKQIAKAIYLSPQENEKHWVIIELKGTNMNMTNQINFNLINFNLDHYPEVNFNIKIETLGNNHLVVIRDFKSKTEALNYYSSISVSNEIRREVNNYSDCFVITEANYKTLLKEGNTDTYKVFFKETYQ